MEIPLDRSTTANAKKQSAPSNVSLREQTFLNSAAWHLLLTALAAAFLPALASASPVNLIQNPSAELPTTGPGLPFWTEVQGTDWGQRQHDPEPKDGDYYFFAGVNSGIAELTQLIDVSGYAASIDAGTQTFSFTGYVRSYDEPNADSSLIVIDYQNGSGVVIDEFASAPIISTSAWEPVDDTRTAPVGTRKINVRLISQKNAGSTNDGYYDDLSLTTVPEPATAVLAACGAVLLMVVGLSRRRSGTARQ